MSDHFRHIYSQEAAAYHAMIAAEDWKGHLKQKLRGLLSAYHRPKVLDVGSGTGRFGLMVGDLAGQFLALDLYEAMLQQQKLFAEAADQEAMWDLLQADARAIPVKNSWADVVLAGWALGHLTGWYPSTWRTEMTQALNEMQRVCHPGGIICIAETMTTGGPPAPPNPELAHYYDWLELQWGFSRFLISTDYAFGSVEEAVSKTEFFFGESLAQKVRENQWHILPEWTGLWVKQI
ncbi:MAG: class I SAM-dependent methyltransferase [Ardenticatenaceae bacterium]|nr:class I SAM-dependent methyltransferase [Ardenticatenaceae bacterium]